MKSNAVTRPILLAAVLLLATAPGCGDAGGNRQSITGTVTFDGEPLTEGQIVFIPKRGKGPTAGSEIENGRYAIPADKGTFAGTFRVEITDARDTGAMIVTSWGETISETANFIPPRYNQNSELTAEVNPDGANHFDFSLHSN